jgi:hypothetical protein
MIKRRQGVHVHARTYHNKRRGLRLMALAHNLMILEFVRVFDTAFPTSFASQCLQIVGEAFPIDAC